MSAIGKNLAAKVFKLQNQGGNVPSNVLASSRALLAGNGSPGDLNAVRSFLGIRQSGNSAQQRGLKGIGRTLGQVGQLGFMASQMASGGTNGLFAGIQLTQQVNGIVQKYVASPAFEKLLINKLVTVHPILKS